MNTLPPGWTGNDAEHNATVGTLRLTVYRDSRRNPFTRRNERVGPYLWRVRLGTFTMSTSATTGHPDARDARAAAILAARLIAMEIAQGCDWLDRPPAPLTTAPEIVVSEGVPS